MTSAARPRQLSLPDTAGNGGNANLMSSVAFSPDGKTLAAGDYDGAVTLWDVSGPAAPVQLGQPITVGYTDSVNSVAFSPDGKTLAAGDYDGAVTLWDVSGPAAPVQLGDPITVGDSHSVDSVAFSPDGKTLAAGGDDGISQTWNLDVSYAISRICDLTTGALTQQQWHQDIPQLHYDPPC